MKVSPLPKDDGANVSPIGEQTEIGQIDWELAAYNLLSFLHSCNAYPILEYAKKQVGFSSLRSPLAFIIVSVKSRHVKGRHLKELLLTEMAVFYTCQVLQLRRVPRCARSHPILPGSAQ